MLFDHEYLHQIALIQTIIDQYTAMINYINNHFIFIKAQSRSDYLHDGSDSYPRLQLPYPTNLALVKTFLAKLPQYRASDVDATIISLQHHLNGMNAILTDIFVTYRNIQKTSQPQLQSDLKQLIAQYQRLDHQLGIDLKQLQSQQPEQMIFAYATTNLDDSQQNQQLRAVINKNHQIIAQTDAMLTKAKQVNQLLKESDNHAKS